MSCKPSSGCCPPKEATPPKSSGCCPPAETKNKAADASSESARIKGAVASVYGRVAEEWPARAEASRKVAEAFGYSAEELLEIGDDANMGLSCGNPTAIANLREGEVVCDLGCGGGMDVFLAAKKVGPNGRVIGIDMTQAMIDRARASAKRRGAENVEFHLAEIESLEPVASDSVDCVISNCVINLVVDKPKAFEQIFRVLKPGGRVALSDIALKKVLPQDLKSDMAAYTGCISGAILTSEYEQGLRDAGFEAIRVLDMEVDLNCYAELGQGSCCTAGVDDEAIVREEADPAASGGGCCAPAPAPAPAPAAESSSCCAPKAADKPLESFEKGMKRVLDSYDVNSYAASVKVYALKPAAAAPAQGKSSGSCCSKC